MQARLSALQTRPLDDPAPVTVLRAAQVEIDMFLDFSEQYAHPFYLV